MCRVALSLKNKAIKQQARRRQRILRQRQQGPQRLEKSVVCGGSWRRAAAIAIRGCLLLMVYGNLFRLLSSGVLLV